MGQASHVDAQLPVISGHSPAAPAPRVLVRSIGPTPASALALQRAAGNRAAARVLSRWAKHPDEKEKGKLLSDGAADDYLHFNVPLNK